MLLCEATSCLDLQGATNTTFPSSPLSSDSVTWRLGGMETTKVETDGGGDQGLWDLEGASARDRWSVGLISLSLILQTSQQVPDKRSISVGHAAHGGQAVYRIQEASPPLPALARAFVNGRSDPSDVFGQCKGGIWAELEGANVGSALIRLLQLTLSAPAHSPSPSPSPLPSPSALLQSDQQGGASFDVLLQALRGASDSTQLGLWRASLASQSAHLPRSAFSSVSPLDLSQSAGEEGNAPKSAAVAITGAPGRGTWTGRGAWTGSVPQYPQMKLGEWLLSCRLADETELRHDDENVAASTGGLLPPQLAHHNARRSIRRSSEKHHWMLRCWGTDAFKYLASVNDAGVGGLTMSELAWHAGLPCYVHDLAHVFRAFTLARSPQERLALARNFINNCAKQSCSRSDPPPVPRITTTDCLLTSLETRDFVNAREKQGWLGDDILGLVLGLLEQPLLHPDTMIDAAIHILLPLARCVVYVHACVVCIPVCVCTRARACVRVCM